MFMNPYQITSLTFLFSFISLHASHERVPLTDRILHYETLSYDVDPVRLSHEKIRKSRSSSLTYSNRHIVISFYALNRNFTLELRPSQDVFSHNARFLVHTKEGLIQSTYDPLTFYKGRLAGDPYSKVQGHVFDGMFDGEITTGQKERYHIESADKYFNGRKHFHSVIYSLKDVLFQPEGHVSSCGAKKKLLSKMEQLQATAKPIGKRRQRHTQQEGNTPQSLSSQFRRRRNIQKRTETVSEGRYCQVFIAADHLFVSNIAGGSESAAVSEIASIFSSVQEIYISSDFDDDGTPDGIVPILVKTELLNASSYGSLFSSSNIEVGDYLDRWSTINHNPYCLSLLLTYRDFSDGVLGLAWVAQPPGGSRGGICEERASLSIGDRSLNTAIVTYLNYGSRQPRAIVSITIAHEFGHNFGSSHDPEGSSECAPGGGSGNYIMYPRATDGNRANNDVFSPCSRASIEQILRTKTDCFTKNNAFCGNQIVEEGEECDCGSSDTGDCDEVDPCCKPGECELKESAQCSGADDCCDRSSCTFKSSSSVCREETQCAEQSLCTGDSAQCPDLVNRNMSCNNGTRFCENGECAGSVCLVLVPPRADCQCSVESEQCHVCCMIDQTCTSTFTLASNGMLSTPGQYRESGRSCDDYRGYCSDDSIPRCIGVDNEQTLNDLLDLFSEETLNSVLRWLKTYWWVPIVVVVGIIIIILLLHFTYRKRKPIKKVARRASLSVSRQGRQGGAGQAVPPRLRARKEARESLQRLKKFFPSCDQETIASVLRSSKTEEKTVRQLITIGFPMKKVPTPRL